MLNNINKLKASMPPNNYSMAPNGGGTGGYGGFYITGTGGTAHGANVHIVGQKFRRGDIIVANENARQRFPFADEGWTCRVLDTSNNGELLVEQVPNPIANDYSTITVPQTTSYTPTNVVHEDYFDSLDDYMKKRKASGKATTKVFDLTKLDPLIIEQKVKEEISSVLKQHKNKDVLFKEWGLGEVIEYGRGMSFLFYGPPGTGKTWAAHCIAKCLGTDLLVMSAAEIQSSEPGAANRNIQQAFATAQKEGKVLFLDECDSLIVNRADLGMVLAGEVNTLLTEIEKSEGVVILATNRVEYMDEALERRISLIAEFPAPDLEQRKEIWKKLLPKKMPLAKDVKVDELAKHRLTGGQIKNAVLAAARLALGQEKKEVAMSHFITGIDRILASKNLMGSASRYHQAPVDDFSRSPGRNIGAFINRELTKTKVDDIDVDINPDKSK